MDIFDIHDVKAEKASAMLQYQQFRKIAKLLRIIELLSAVVLFSWISTRLPLVIGVFSDYFRLILSVVVSPVFIFLIGNAIIVTLVVKSGEITDNRSDVDNNGSGSDLYEEIANNNNNNNVVAVVPPVIEPEEIVYQDKQITSQGNANSINITDEVKVKVNPITKKLLTGKVNSVQVSDLDLKTYRRSKSESLMKNECKFLDLENPEKVNGKLKRSETEIGRREVETPAVVEELSNEEFQRWIEGFIARQNIRFHHEEKLAIVAHNNN